jgi:hypothetical protein
MAAHTLSAYDEIILEPEFLSAQKLSVTNKYPTLETMDPGAHKILIRFPNLPDVETFVFRLERPAIQENTFKYIFKNDLINTGEQLGEKVPTATLSSRSFLPGEKIKYIVEEKTDKIGKAKFKSKPLELTPNPLIVQSKDGATIKANLGIYDPTCYWINFSGFKEREQIEFVSSSSGESGRSLIRFDKPITMNYMPGVVGKNGGFAQIKIIRSNGEELKLDLPWGSELNFYLKGLAGPVTNDLDIKM